MEIKTIYCCECHTNVDAKLVTGELVYPHRRDLYSLPFWMCPECRNFVGCHHKSKNRTHPLGVIPSKEIKQFRSKIHAVLDPIWQTQIKSRRAIYAELSGVLGREYHTAKLRTIEECETILNYLNQRYYDV